MTIHIDDRPDMSDPLIQVVRITVKNQDRMLAAEMKYEWTKTLSDNLQAVFTLAHSLALDVLNQPQPQLQTATQ